MWRKTITCEIGIENMNMYIFKYHIMKSTKYYKKFNRIENIFKIVYNDKWESNLYEFQKHMVNIFQGTKYNESI